MAARKKTPAKATKKRTTKKTAPKRSRKAEQEFNLLEQLARRLNEPAKANVNTLMVGLRNISNNTIGMTGSPTPHEPDVQMAPDHTSVISYAWWRQIRSGKLVRNGLIVRDDTALGPVDVAAPADELRDLPADAAKNQVFNATTWITSRTEHQIRDDVTKMDSESSLRRLQFAIDMKVEEIRQSLGCDGKDAKKEKLAASSLPWQYALAEKLVEERLHALAPSLEL